MNEELKKRFLKVKRSLFEAYYDKLNEKQQEAVFSVDGPLLVLAGAGSGKTTVLVNRIAHILNFGNAYYTDELLNGLDEATVLTLENIYNSVLAVSKDDLKNLLKNFAYNPPRPWEILSITFTNKAANEMKERLAAILGEDSKDVWAGTFHSICVKILRANIERIGYQSAFSIYDTDDSKKIIQGIIKTLELDDDMFVPKTVLSIISRYKNKLVEPNDLVTDSADFRTKTLTQIYKMYQNTLKESNAVDFDDIIGLTIKLFQQCPDVLEKYRSRFKYILIDEYQDTNGAQLELMKLLCEKYRNIMVVGDDDQSIYKFRGAVVENILRFDSEFRDAKVIFLEQNYRSTKTILDAANAVIGHNEGRKGKKLWTDFGDGEKIDFCKLENQDAEARYIVDRICEYVRDGKYTYGDFAVLYRVNAQSNNLETAFAKAAIPHRLLGGTRFYDRKEIRDVVAYLSVVLNPYDSIKLERIINVPKRGIGDSTLNNVKTLASAENKSVFDIMEQASSYSALSKAAPKLEKFVKLIRELQKVSETHTLDELIKHVVYDSGYFDSLMNSLEDGKDRIDNINELISNALKFSEDNPEGTLLEFLEDVALVADVDSYEAGADAVVLMTMHSAKGLEFPVVFLPGMEENIIPSPQSTNTQDDIEEERRLAYVAITRAQKKLIITNATSRLMFGRTMLNQNSRFLREIPLSLINALNTTVTTKTIDRIAYDNLSANGSYKSQKVEPQKKSQEIQVFNVGERVVHQTFGEGVVLLKKEMSSDVLYEVAFDSVGTKKLMGTYAKLKKA